MTAAELRARLTGVMPADRRSLKRRLGGAERIADKGRRDKVLDVLAADLAKAEQRLERRKARRPTSIAYPEELPITERRDELLETIAAHQVVIVAGETGSGKSTQIPKLCIELGRGVHGLIGHTQPRRIAARSIAERVAEELHTSLGDMVGYTVRFNDQVGDETFVKVMTDGILLNEIHHDRKLVAYDTIIIDEAHERSLNVDFLLGYLKRLLPKRPDLKVIITSATIDTERFSQHFDNAPIVEVSGRMYPVEVRYRPLDDPSKREASDQPQGIADAVLELFTEADGDILVFCSGEREIRDAADAVEGLDLPHTEALPLFGRLSAAEQHRVFEPHTGRRVVIATNVAETSLTVPGIRAVVDSGVARVSRFSRRTKVQRLPIEPISKASADQRAGRCGRLGPGVCIRLYSEDDFASRDEFTEPEILRTNLASVMLRLAALDLGDFESFPFLDPPDRRAIRDGVDLLGELGAVHPDRVGTGRWLTPLGRRLARMPIDLRLGRMLLAAAEANCLDEMMVIASALAIQDPRDRPLGKEQQADQRHARFRSPDSDLLSWLVLWRHLNDARRSRSSNQFRRMCRDEFLNYRRVREWQDVHSQLRQVARDLDLDVNRQPADPEVIHRAALVGLLSHIGMKEPEGFEYRGARSSRFAINPGSVLFKAAPRWVMAGELVETTRMWARQVAPIQPEWAEQAAPHLVKRSYSDPWWDADQGAALSYETVTLFGLPLVSGRLAQHARFAPEQARELFIHHALVLGEWDRAHDFVAHNRQRIDEVLALQTRHRRTDLLRSDAAIAAWFTHRIPDDVVSARHFDTWWKRARKDDPELLFLSEADLIEPTATPPDEEAFPEVWHHGDLDMPLDYELAPGSETDGFVVEVPLEGLDRVDPSLFDWLVPGLREELFTTLIRSLPKPLRKQFVPIPDTVRDLLPQLDPADGPITQVLRRVLAEGSELELPVDAFSLDGLAAHLRPTFRVIDAEGEVVAAGVDLRALKDELKGDVRGALAATGHDLEVSGATSWSFGVLPPSVVIEGRGATMTAFPTLTDDGDSVSVRLVATEDEQVEGMWEGTRRLLQLALPSPTRLLQPLLTNEAKLAIRSAPYAESGDWVRACLTAGLDRLIDEAGGAPLDGTGFDALVRSAHTRLADVVTGTATDSIRLFGLLRDVRTRLDRVTADVFSHAVVDATDQLARLIHPGFLSDLGGGRLPDVARYVEAIGRRLDQLPENPARDRKLTETVRSLEAEVDRLAGLFPGSRAVVEIGWMLQELRVSFFAQTLGTRGKVSEARVRRAIAEVVG